MNDSLGWCRITRACSIGGKRHEAGERLQVSADVFRQLVRDGLAVSCGEPGRILTAPTMGTRMEGRV